MRKAQYLFLILPLLLFGCYGQEKVLLRIDHIILAIEDLDRGMQQFEEITGVMPIYGGEHPNGDTQNAIIAFQDGMYLEILAPKPGLDSIPTFFQGMNTLTAVGFALNTNNIVRLHQELQGLQFKSDEIQDGSRNTPSGKRLSWQMLMVSEPAFFMNPFFIDWSPDSQHPSKSEEINCTLSKLQLTSPFGTKLKQLIKACESEIPLLLVEEGTETNLSISLRSPKGIHAF